MPDSDRHRQTHRQTGVGKLDVVGSERYCQTVTDKDTETETERHRYRQTEIGKLDVVVSERYCQHFDVSPKKETGTCWRGCGASVVAMRNSGV